MIRHLAIAILATAALGGCATDYTYRGGAGDYYYGRPSVEYYDYGYGALYGSAYGYPGGYWRGGLGIGYGYGGYGGYGYPYGYYGGGYPYYPYYWYRRPHHHDHRPPHSDGPARVTGGNLRPDRVRRDPPRSPVQMTPRNGQRPMRPPSAGAPWRGGTGIAQPPMSRPAPQMVRQPSGGRVNAVERRPSPPAVRQSRPSPPSVSREREPVRKQEL